MNRYLAVALLAFGLLHSSAVAQEKKRPPNIILILADDLGWTDVACCGKSYLPTPNLDRMAKQGVRFTSAYTAGPNCQPTRAALMSGQYGPRTGVFTVGTSARGEASQRKLVPVENTTKLPPETTTVAQALKKEGYATALFGKWHLGEDAKHHPSQRGFDEAVVSMGKHFEFKTNPPLKVAADAYLADFLTDHALRFIEKNKDRPFFLYLSHFGVHTPHQAKEALIKKNRAAPDPVYAAMIESLDESVGRVLATLAELGLDENTIIIFSSDNGGVGAGNNRPLRAGKGTLYEGGVRVPMIVRWNGVTPGGKTCDEPVISVDFFATFIDLAGSKGGAKLDGVSFRPLLREPTARLPREALYWHFPCYREALGKKKNKGGGIWRTTPGGSIRAGDWKLIEYFEDGRLELYNLKDDLGQANDLAAMMPDRTRQLHARLVEWRKSVNAPMPRSVDAGNGR